MAKIMIEAKTQEKDRKASMQPDNTKWTDAVAKIVVFDDVEISLLVSLLQILEYHQYHFVIV